MFIEQLPYMNRHTPSVPKKKDKPWVSVSNVWLSVLYEIFL